MNKNVYHEYMNPTRQWYKRFDQFMMEQGFNRSSYDHYVYFRKLGEGINIYLLLYVDDMLIACSSSVEVKKMKDQLSKSFDMKDLGEARKILGMKIKRDRVKGVVWLMQSQYLEKLISMFDLNEKSKIVSTPLAPQMKLIALLSPTTEEETEEISKVSYANAMGR